MDFLLILEGFGEGFGSQDEAKLVPKCCPRGLRKQLCSKMQKVPKVQYVCHFWGFGASKIDEKSIKNRLKIDEKITQNWSAIFDASWRHFGGQLGLQNPPKIASKSKKIDEKWI